MHVERKKTKYGDAFWVLRFCNVEEKEEYIRRLNILIGETIKEEFQNEYSYISNTFEKAEHNEKYDEDNYESVIIHSSQIASLLSDLFFLCFGASKSCKEYGETLDKYNETLVKYNKTLDEHNEGLVKHGETLNELIDVETKILDFSENIMNTDIPISRYGISCASIAILTGKEDMVEGLTTAKMSLSDEADERIKVYDIAIENVSRLLEPVKKEAGDTD